MHLHFLENHLITLFLLGLFLVIVAYFWLLVRSFLTHRGWGWFSLLVPGVGPLIFSFSRWSRARPPLILFLIGATLISSAYGINKYQIWFPDLGKRNKIVDGERHITLTGWDRKDYSFLQNLSDTVVLQMANSDVNDETLVYLKGMKKLKELDLNDTKVTDKGLAELSDLPLEILRLRGTEITDKGFVGFLQNKSGLKQIDLRNTEVTTALLRTWKKEAEGRTFLR